MKKVVVLGDILYDCFVWADRLPRMGETVMGYANGFYSGGKGANQAVQAAKLGAETYFIGKVGTDANGDFLIRTLQEYGVHTDYVFRDEKTATGTCCIHVDSNGNNAIIVAPLANLAITPEELKQAEEVITQADVFITQLLLEEEIVKAGLKTAYEAGVMTIFNPAPAKKISDELFTYSTIVTPNETEAEQFTGCYLKETPLEEWKKETAARMKQKGTEQLVITLGKEGSCCCTDGETVTVPCFKVDAVDSTGAGDAFNAAMAVRLSEGAGIREAMIYGSAAGALTVMGKGAQSAMPVREEVDAFLSEHQK